MPVSPAKVRELVARLDRTQEGAHRGHPDFRVDKRIFATLSEGEDRAALRLGQIEARELARSRPNAFRLVSDREPYSWLSVLLEGIDEDELGDLLEEAWALRGGRATAP
jgi:hypothetical protein